MNDCVLTRDDNEIRVVTLNRPERLNAITPALLDGLNRTLVEGDQNPAIGAMVLTGAGRAFCAGDDLIEQQSMQHANRDEIVDFVASIQDVTRNIMFCDTPVVAAVHGWAVGGAFSWPVNCDLNVWADDARAFFPELNIGLFVSGAVTHLLPLHVGAGRAREMIYLGKTYDAKALRACGLVNEIVARQDLLGAAIDRARQIARLPSAARVALKQVLLAGERDQIERSLDMEAGIVVDCLSDPKTYARMKRESDVGRGK